MYTLWNRGKQTSGYVPSIFEVAIFNPQSHTNCPFFFLYPNKVDNCCLVVSTDQCGGYIRMSLSDYL